MGISHSSNPVKRDAWTFETITVVVDGPVLVAEQLPAANPVKKSALAYVSAYEAANGKGSVSTFGAHAWDTGLLMAAAVPVALKKAQPGTPEFRTALRDAIFTTKDVVRTHAIYNFKPGESYGVDERSLVLVRLANGQWKYEP